MKDSSTGPATGATKPATTDSATIPAKTDSTTKHATTVSMVKTGERKIFLQVVPVNVVSPDGKTLRTHAILDQCSQATLIRNDVSKMLGLDGKTTELTLSTVSDLSHNVASKQVSFSVTAASFQGNLFEVQNAYSVSKEHFKLSYTQHLPPEFDSDERFKHLQGLGFEDVCADEISILIGADVPKAIIGTEIREGPEGSPLAVFTPLGWTLFGVSDGAAPTTASHHIKVDNQSSLDTLVHSLWNNESFGTVSKVVHSLYLWRRGRL